MENWERRFDRVQTPDSSVPSHREGLRMKLLSGRIPRGHRLHTAVTLSILAVVIFSGLTVVYPSWAKDLWKTPFVQTITLHTKDGHTVMIKKMTLDQCGDICDTSACDSSWKTPDGRQYFRKRIHSGNDTNGPLRIKMVCADTSDLTAFLRDGIELPQEFGKTARISSPDGEKIWIINGDTLDAKNVTATSGYAAESDLESFGSPHEQMDAQKDLRAGVTENPNLLHNYPNPFNPTTQISFQLKQSGLATLKVYSMTGQEVAALVDGYTQAGQHTVMFDGSRLASGTYLYTLRAEGVRVTRAMVLTK